jgi:dTDP-4-amino-4,6-dideoxygalactose transaminase
VTLKGLRAGFAALLTGHDGRTRLEQELASAYDVQDVLLTDSGTSALALALRSAATAAGTSTVALPGWGCYDLATAADAAGVDVLLYDLLPETLGPDWGSLDRVLAQGVAAVVVVHPFGLPVDLPEVQQRAARSGAMVIEDAAQAVGATVAGRPAGASGDYGILSFGRGKGLTGGGGGALLRRAGGLPLLAAPLDPAGWSGPSLAALCAQWALGRPALYGIPASLPFLGLGQTVYHTASPARQIGRAEACVLPTAFSLQRPEAERRRYHVTHLLPALEAVSETVPRPWEGGTAGWLRLPVLPSDRMLAAAESPSAKRLGIVASYPLALVDLPGFARVRNREERFAGARLMAARLRTLPTHGLLQDSDLSAIIAWLRQLNR